MRAAATGSSGPRSRMIDREVAAVDQLHDDERVARLHAVVEDVDHVGMAERGGGLRLLAEARHEAGSRPYSERSTLTATSRPSCASWAR